MSLTPRRAPGARRGARGFWGTRKKPRRLLALLVVAAFVALGSAAALTAGSAALERSAAIPAVTPSSEIDAGDFDPGLIISDYNFYNAEAMTSDEVQAFLENRSCHPRDDSPCLWEYRESTVSQPAAGAGHCESYLGKPHERASTIISRVAEACGISPRVLLVLLQKEQSLLTAPNESGYLRATGYGCPDTADCNADYFGFFNQVYNAAWQFRQYTQEPDRAFQIGRIDVGYHPDADCGSSRVQIENQATANLYNYTPYQPSPETIEGADTDCSAYGNLNFWSFYSQWFGETDTERYPDFFEPCLNLVGGQPCRPGTLFG
ncbi:hypothetical protein D6T64_20310 [Cryobacterium melibiosiphilum]|uniref:Hemagglutinin n=1 Tax=Cryobacterium melibiosiphilum TaxID=995039 RepID=A0A3A5MA66_9MICO|nr:hypothetical protein [Cryobacterium melibiosiphilum]RJT85255.1 hypothetical protein D6T64_20310 [Cryobacterium melibiosiphilum]